MLRARAPNSPDLKPPAYSIKPELDGAVLARDPVSEPDLEVAAKKAARENDMGMVTRTIDTFAPRQRACAAAEGPLLEYIRRDARIPYIV